MSAQPVDCDVAEVVWWGTHTLRLRAHSARGVSRCPTRVAPYSAKDPEALRTNLRCREDGCLGIVHTVYVATTARLKHQTDGRVYRLPTGSATHVEWSHRRWPSWTTARVARGLPESPLEPMACPGV